MACRPYNTGRCLLLRLFNCPNFGVHFKNHRKNSNKLTNEWTGFMNTNPTKKQILKKRDELEKKYFGNKGDNPNN